MSSKETTECTKCGVGMMVSSDNEVVYNDETFDVTCPSCGHEMFAVSKVSINYFVYDVDYDDAVDDIAGTLAAKLIPDGGGPQA